MNIPSSHLNRMCAETVLNGGLKGFIRLFRQLSPSNTSNNPEENLKIFAHYAVIYFGISVAKLAEVTGGNSETNQLWPPEARSTEQCEAIRAFLSSELMKTYKQLDTVLCTPIEDL